MGFLESLKRQFTLATVSGVPVRADSRWFFVLGLLSLVIAAAINPITESWGVSLIFGLIATLIFFASIFLHEFAHALAARMEDLRVVEIVLHPFGGLTRFRHEPETPRAEFRIAIAGPAASFILAVVFVIAAVAASTAELGVIAVLMYTLAIGNFLVAVFNMFPGYPLDGGRVLRAYLWRSGRDLNEATVLTGRVGQGIAVVTVIFGLYIAAIRGDLFTGLWAMMVGFFLFDSADGIIKEVEKMSHVAVEDVMMLAIAIEPETILQDFIDHTLPMYRQGVFPVSRNKQLLGMLKLADMKAVEPAKRRTTSIGDVMTVVTGDHFVEIGTALPSAKELAQANGIGAVGVIDHNGKLVGMIFG
ncbi:MAG: site-2 protease family protein [Pyrinomonadaceae bacterium]|nr:site-2 protease family protein [Pyrinomonadaceae bacterium]